MKEIIFKGCLCTLIIISLTGCTSPEKPHEKLSCGTEHIEIETIEVENIEVENIQTWENSTTTWD